MRWGGRPAIYLLLLLLLLAWALLLLLLLLLLGGALLLLLRRLRLRLPLLRLPVQRKGRWQIVGGCCGC